MGAKSYSRKHPNVTFTHRLVGLLVKLVDFSNLCCIMCQRCPFKNGETALFNFVLQSLQACNSRSIKDILMPF